MKVYSTSGVSLDTLVEFANDAGPELDIEVSKSQLFRKAAEPSFIITLLDHIKWWHTLGLLALPPVKKYGETLAQAAAKEHWDNRKEIIAAATNSIKKLSSAIAKLARRSKPETTIAIGIPFPNEYFSTHLELENISEESVTVQVVLFLQHLQQLETLLEELKNDEPATGIFLKLLDNGSMEAMWFDRKTLREHIRTLPQPIGES